MKKQLMSKSRALLWFYDVFFCHSNHLEKDQPYTMRKRWEDEINKEKWEKRWPNEDDDEVKEHFIAWHTLDYRRRFANKTGKTLREIRLYEKQIRAYLAWDKAGREKPNEQPWYFVLLDLFCDLFYQKKVNKKDFLSFFELNERTFNRYIQTIREYQMHQGKNEFAVHYDAKAKLYRSIPSGFPSPVNKQDNFKVW